MITSASFESVAESKTVTLSLSGLAIQTRPEAASRASHIKLEDRAGECSVGAS